MRTYKITVIEHDAEKKGVFGVSYDDVPHDSTTPETHVDAGIRYGLADALYWVEVMEDRNAPDEYRGVPVPAGLKPNWNQVEADWWRRGIHAAQGAAADEHADCGIECPHVTRGWTP